MTLILTGTDITGAVPLRAVIDAVEEAHAAEARGLAVQPERAAVHVPGSHALMIPMVAAIGPVRAAGVKVLMDLSGNPAPGYPAQQSVILLMNTETGACEAVLDGAAITSVRTAAASAVATRHLARPEARVLGLIGAGRQAGAHLDAILEVHPVDRVLIWNRTRARADRLAETYRDRVAVDVLDSPEKVVRGCDILCTLTPSREPIVQGAWFAPGLHVNAVGAPPRLDHREVDTEAILRSHVVVDNFSTAVAESGDVMIPVAEHACTSDHFTTELGHVIVGSAPGRTSADQITLYNSVGVGLQDIAMARLVVDAARRLGRGQEIAFSGTPVVRSAVG